MLLHWTAEWDDDMTYLYVEYGMYKHFLMGMSMISVRFIFNSSSSDCYITTIFSSTTRLWPLQLRWQWDWSYFIATECISSTENRSSGVIFLTSMFKWELMNSLKKENHFSTPQKPRNGCGTLLISMKPSPDATDRATRMTLQTSQTLKCSSKTSSEGTQMRPKRCHSSSALLELVNEPPLKHSACD